MQISWDYFQGLCVIMSILELSWCRKWTWSKEMTMFVLPDETDFVADSSVSFSVDTECIWLTDFLNQRNSQIDFKDTRKWWPWTISLPINILPRPLEFSPLPFSIFINIMLFWRVSLFVEIKFVHLNLCESAKCTCGYLSSPL